MTAVFLQFVLNWLCSRCKHVKIYLQAQAMDIFPFTSSENGPLSDRLKLDTSSGFILNREFIQSFILNNHGLIRLIFICC